MSVSVCGNSARRTARTVSRPGQCLPSGGVGLSLAKPLSCPGSSTSSSGSSDRESSVSARLPGSFRRGSLATVRRSLRRRSSSPGRTTVRARGFASGGEVDGEEEGESEEEEGGKREVRQRLGGGGEVSAERRREEEGWDGGRDDEGVGRLCEEGVDRRREREKDGVGGCLLGRLRQERQRVEKPAGPERMAGERRQEWQRVIVIRMTKGRGRVC